MKEERFVWDDVKFRRRNHLPHVDVAGGLYFITYCLADAIAPDFLTKMKVLRQSLSEQIRERFGKLTAADQRQIEQTIRLEVFTEMDRARGRCELAIPEVADLVTNSLLHFHAVRYRLDSYCVMPNHVHAVFQPEKAWPWWKIAGGWKSFTAKEANKLLGKSGRFWQDDSYETLIRSPQHLERAVNYVLRNPEKAGLKDWPWVGQP